MATLYDIPAPAKINLFLHILGRRADGYHLMQSVFVLLDLHDTLHIEALESPIIQRMDLPAATTDAPLPADDLTVRAARLLQQATGCTKGAAITLHKRIPSQAGMGGGSSDAASCLIALNHLWQTGLNRAQLMALGLQLGADVPFFIHGTSAWVEGIGEQITPIHTLPQRYLIAKPRQGVSTATIFTDPSLNRNTKPATMASFAEHSSLQGCLFGHNDLQAVAERHCPEVRECIDWVATQGLNARMTGSGSAVFAPVGNTGTPPDTPACWRVGVYQSLQVHPLKNWLS